MSRRNQSSRRRSYGRRQHEVRERRPDTRPEGATWLDDPDTDFEAGRSAGDSYDDRGAFGESFGGYTQEQASRSTFCPGEEEWSALVHPGRPRFRAP